MTSACFENHTECTSALLGQNGDFFSVKASVLQPAVTTVQPLCLKCFDCCDRKYQTA